MVSLSIMSLGTLIVLMVGGHLGFLSDNSFFFKTVSVLSDISLFFSGLHPILHLVYSSHHIGAVSGPLHSCLCTMIQCQFLVGMSDHKCLYGGNTVNPIIGGCFLNLSFYIHINVGIVGCLVSNTHFCCSNRAVPHCRWLCPHLICKNILAYPIRWIPVSLLYVISTTSSLPLSYCTSSLGILCWFSALVRRAPSILNSVCAKAVCVCDL